MIFLNNDLISIVVPVYNAEATIERCIRSLLSQSHGNIEVILVDDGSTDSSAKICGSFAESDRRVRFIRTENNGVSSARNTGILAANGSYIAFCDSDDYTDERWISVLLDLAKTSGADIAVCGYELSLQKKNVFPFYRKIPGCADGEEAMLVVLTRGGCGGFLWNKLFRAELMKENLLDGSLHFCEDMCAVISCLKDGARVCYTNEPLYHYCCRNGSLTTGFSDKSLSVFAAYEKAASFDVTERVRLLLNARRAEAATNLYINAIECGLRDIAAELKSEACSGKSDFFKCRDISSFEKIRFLIKLHAPLLSSAISRNKKISQ